MILIVNFGSQYTHVIWRACRDLGHDAKIVTKGVSDEELAGATGLILSGGPSSVTTDDFGKWPERIRRIADSKWKIPLLGICLGHQLIAYNLGGKVVKGKNAEYGLCEIVVDEEDEILKGMPKKFQAWASHFDEVKQLPPKFRALAHSAECGIEAYKHESLPIFGVQFHPEVWHTENGEQVLKNFLEFEAKK